MKKIISFVFSALLAASVFAQNDFTPLAVVKLNSKAPETITVKNLKSRIAFLEKQQGASARTTSPENRAKILDEYIAIKLINQQAQKDNITVKDSDVDAAFLNMFSAQAGTQLSYAQVEEIIKAQYKMSIEEYIKNESGMSLAEFKSYLKSSLTVQQYVVAKNQAELQTVAATDEEIRAAYEMNKSVFVWNDMMKIFLVSVPKSGDNVEARAKAQELFNQYKKDPKSINTIKSSKDNGSKYRAGETLVYKNSAYAQQIRWPYEKLIDLFGKNIGFVNEVEETAVDFQFYAILKKYDAKMLALSDLYQPETTYTVYDYIKGNLSQQKQAQFLQQAVIDLTNKLDTTENVDRKKTGDDLLKLLNW